MQKQRDWNELKEAAFDAGRFICVGLDPDEDHLRDDQKLTVQPWENCRVLAREVVQQTCEIAGFYKINLAFWLKHGWPSLKAMEILVEHIQHYFPQVPIILDCKSCDIENTGRQIAHFAFKDLNVDAVTVHWNYGPQSLMPFLERSDKGVFVVCKGTEGHSWNELVAISEAEARYLGIGAGVPWRDQSMCKPETLRYEHIAYEALQANGNKNVGLVVSGKDPIALRLVRRIVGDDMPILGIGFGAQGANLQEAAVVGVNRRNRNFIPGASRRFINSKDPRAEAQAFHEEFATALCGS